MTGQVIHARGGPGSNGSIANVFVSDIEAGDVMMTIFLGMCLGYDPVTPCPNATAHVPADTKLPSFTNMTFRRIHTRYAAERFIDLFGIEGHEQISSIVLEDLSVDDVGLVNGGHVASAARDRPVSPVRDQSRRDGESVPLPRVHELHDETSLATRRLRPRSLLCDSCNGLCFGPIE